MNNQLTQLVTQNVDLEVNLDKDNSLYKGKEVEKIMQNNTLSTIVINKPDNSGCPNELKIKR